MQTQKPKPIPNANPENPTQPDPTQPKKNNPIQALVAKGVEVDSMHPDGVSALMYAAAGGHPEVVKVLLEGEGPAKADPNLKHVQGGTALMEAATSGSQEVVDLLLAAGADPMVRDKDGVSPLMSAAAQVSYCPGGTGFRGHSQA